MKETAQAIDPASFLILIQNLSALNQSLNRACHPIHSAQGSGRRRKTGTAED